MTKRSGKPFVVVCVGLVLAGCQAKTSPSLSSPAPVQEQLTEGNLLDWLREQPFEPAPSEGSEVVTSGLPEGFEVNEPDSWTDELPSGETVQVTQVSYARPEGGQIAAENYVEVHIVGSPSVEARSGYFEMALSGAEDVEWSLESLGGSQVVRFQADGTDGRILISGPYLVFVIGSAEGRSPWVDAIAELYLDLPASPEISSVPSPLDWLRERPFEPAPGEQPQVITDGLPENWHALDPDFETGELPSGEMVQFARVVYQWPVGGQVDAENEVRVRIVGCQSAEARSEIIDSIPEEEYEVSLEQIDSAQIVRFHDNSTDGRSWVSGGYLITVIGSAPDRSPWVDMFTEFYLALYPAA